MAIELDYITQLKTLYEAYSGKELEKAIGVTVRSMQNYLREDNPAVPGREVVVAIREAFAKHIRGEALKSPEPVLVDQGIQAKYIAMLEKRVTDLERTAGQSTAIERQLAEVKSDLMMIAALQKGFHEYMTEFCGPKGLKPAEALKTIHSRALSSLASMKKEGIQI